MAEQLTALPIRVATTATTIPVLFCSPLVVSEADGYAEFTVRLSAPSASLVSVGYATGNGTADSWNQAGFHGGGRQSRSSPPGSRPRPCGCH